MMLRVLLALCVMVLFSGCAAQNTLINQKQDSSSPSTKYIVSVPIERADDGNRYWFVTLKDVAGEAVYKDEGKEFSAKLQVYWIWDAGDRLWLYSPDTGRVYVWINKEGNWEKNLWGFGRGNRVYKEAIQPPDDLFPPYLKIT